MLLREQLIKSMQTNTSAAINLVPVIMPHWRERKMDYLVVDSSMGLYWGKITPDLGAYCASKAALDCRRFLYTYAWRRTYFLTGSTGINETLAAKVADLGYIKTLLIDAGFFRTNMAAPQKHAETLSSSWGNYPAFNDVWSNITQQLHGDQPGDTAKGARLIVGLVRGRRHY